MIKFECTKCDHTVAKLDIMQWQMMVVCEKCGDDTWYRDNEIVDGEE